MSATLIRNAILINEGELKTQDVLIKDGKIEKIANSISDYPANTHEIEAKGLALMPGVIDGQVHFREPGLTHKAEIYTEAKAAVAGGVTSYMEMPNTVPNALTQELLQQKYDRAAQCSLANYSFYMGASNDNLEELKKTSQTDVCGVKIFMGSSTGDMLVDNATILDTIFGEVPNLIAIHSESEKIVKKNLQIAIDKYGEDIPITEHPTIRSIEACMVSTQFAIDLANKHNTRLHILHISTQDELSLFRNDIPLSQKRITTEVCVHHLWFSASEYRSFGNLIKCNPAIKEAHHRKALWGALLDNRLDIIATDHAPHTSEEKRQKYLQAPSGIPLVQHSLQMMTEAAAAGKISMERVIEKMCHAPAECFKLQDRGYIREGYWADLVLIDLNNEHKVTEENTYYKCGWSTLEGHLFPSKIISTFVNGNEVYKSGQFNEEFKGSRLKFSAH